MPFHFVNKALKYTIGRRDTDLFHNPHSLRNPDDHTDADLRMSGTGLR